jgi:hypothetical protein
VETEKNISGDSISLPLDLLKLKGNDKDIAVWKN